MSFLRLTIRIEMKFFTIPKLYNKSEYYIFIINIPKTQSLVAATAIV